MKHIALALLALVTISGCAIGPADEDAVTTVQDPSYPPGAGFQGPVGQPCTAPTYRMLELDGKAFWVALPTPCDSRHYVFKGDPGPEEWQTLQYDEVTKERVIQQARSLQQ